MKIVNSFALMLGMAMRLRQKRNDADNAHICANMRNYLRIYADMRIDSHQCASANFGAWPSITHPLRMAIHYDAF